MENKERTSEEILKEIMKVLDKIRPYLNSEGGDLEFVKFEDGIKRMIETRKSVLS